MVAEGIYRVLLPNQTIPTIVELELYSEAFIWFFSNETLLKIHLAKSLSHSL